MFKKILPHIIASAVFIMMAVVYFMPHFEGKILPSSDTVQVTGMGHEAHEFYKETGEVTNWTNSMFGGMPTYQIFNPNKSNLLQYVGKVLGLGMEYPVGMFIIGMFSFYIMLLLLGVNSWLAIIGSIFFAFSTNNLILFEAGHSSKVQTLMVAPLIISGMLLVFRKKWLVGLTVFSIGMGLNLFYRHPQMTYYLGLVMLILVIIYGIDAIKNKTLPDYIKSGLVLLLGLVLSIGSTSSILWSTYEYGEDTMRGAPIIQTDNADPNSSSAVQGLAWNYAMQWSNGYRDLLSSYIPRAVGGGSGEKISKDSAFGKMVRSQKEVQAPLYWGALPFTSGPIYFGALVCFLFLFGAISFKSPIKWWLVVSIIFLLFLSLGKNLEFFNRLFFDYFPLFNKFRTPNSVLSIAAVLMPILGILGLQDMINSEDKSKYWRAALWSGGILGGIALVFGLFGGMFFDFVGSSDARYEQFVDVLREDRASLLRSSALRSIFYILVGMAAIWAYSKSKISTVVLAIILGVFGVFDLIQVDTRYVSHSDFVSSRVYKNNFEPRPVDKKILEDTELYFRVHDVTSDPYNSASASYFHKTVGGYHAAKLQRYQDIIDRHLSTNNMAVLNMLNTKYFIIPGAEEGSATYQLNPAALGNAWFVSNINIVENPNAEIDGLTNLDPAVTALVNKEFQGYVKSNTYEKNGQITLTSYAPNKLVFQSNTTSDQFAVFSDIWYGPNKGWVATIDGKSTDYIRANYILRAMNIPAGQHEIVFEFKPSAMATGSIIDLISSGLILLLLGYVIFKAIKDRQIEVDNEKA